MVDENTKTIIKKLITACERLFLYVDIHEQNHPKWNGNRFDDKNFAVKTIEQAKEAINGK